MPNKTMSINILNTFIILSLIASTIGITGCKTRPPEQSEQVAPERQASSQIKASFSITNDGDESLLSLDKSALGKAFLLSSTLNLGSNTPILDHTLPKVVSFELSGDSIALFELNPYSVYEDLPSNKLIQVFPIVSKSEDKLNFKMEFMLSAIPTKGTLAVSDAPATLSNMADPAEEVLPTVASTLKKIEIRGNAVEFTQISRVRTSGLSLSSLPGLLSTGSLSFNTQEATVHLTTQITPYKTNPRFKPILSTLQKGVGYFEIPRIRKNNGNFDVLAAHWDVSPEAGPIIYAITKTVPTELVDAVREGILYWNRVLGREYLRVETDAEPTEIPSYRRAIVRWIPWETAGFARASVQPDPITGEILTADVYLTSAWNLHGRRAVLRNNPASTVNSNKTIAPRGFQAATLCSLDAHAPELALELASIAAITNKKPELQLKAARDMIRIVTAHEVGHTLGLRHNFAGSMGSELEHASDHTAAWEAYLSATDHTGARISSSVMDYFTPMDDLLLGSAIQKGSSLHYDLTAIEWNYGNAQGTLPDRLKAHLFCTDIEAQSKTQIGCQLFDSSQNPIAGYAEMFTQLRKTLANRIVDSFLTLIRSKYPQDQLSIFEAAKKLDPSKIGKLAAEPAQQIFKLLADGAGSLEVSLTAGGRNWMNEKDLPIQHLMALKEYAESVGGVPGLLKTAFGGKADGPMVVLQHGWISDFVQARLDAPSATTGKTLDGVDYTLNPSELEELKFYATIIAQKAELHYMQYVILGLTGVNPEGEDGVLSKVLLLLTGGGPQGYAQSVPDVKWKEDIYKLANAILISTLEKPIEGAKGGQKIEVPAPRYPVELRIAAVNLLSNKVFKQTEWLDQEQEAMAKMLRHRVMLVAQEAPAQGWELLFGGAKKLPTLKDAKLDPVLTKWATEELMVLSALQNADGAGDLFAKLLGAGLAGVSTQEAGVTEDMLMKALTKD